MDKIHIKIKEHRKKYGKKAFRRLPIQVQYELLDVLANERPDMLQDGLKVLQMLKKSKEAAGQPKNFKKLLEGLHRDAYLPLWSEMEKLWHETSEQ